jgi:hypothetical protein
MSLSRKRRRRKHEQRRHHESRPAAHTSGEDGRRDGEAARFSPERLFAERERAEAQVAAPQEASADDGRHPIASETSTPSPGLRQAGEVERLAYTRRQAAEALGVSIPTIDRYVVPAIETIKTPWGQRLIPADELDRLQRNHREPARGRPPRGSAGRPAALPRSVVERIRLEFARGRGLSEIARALTAEGVPTAHGGRRWWPSTVRAVLVRSSSVETS